MTEANAGWMRDIGGSKIAWLLVFVPVALVTRFAAPTHTTLIFVFSSAATIPLAWLLSEATEQAAAHVGPSTGALLNVTFGNAGELVIGFFALQRGLHSLVKASITGSILVNLLLTLGLSMLAGGMRQKTLTFNPLQARTRCTTLSLAAGALIFPAIFHLLGGASLMPREARLSLSFAVILLVTYGLGLLFTLRTHRQLLMPAKPTRTEQPTWTMRSAGVVLAVSALLIGWVGEVMVGSIDAAAHALGMSEMFAGIVIVAIAGNAAETTASVRAALGDRMDLSVGIAVGSSIQVALFVGPALVLLSYVIGPRPLDLVFSPIEILSLVFATYIVGQIAGDGDSNWLEGVQLTAVYLMLVVLFYLLPGNPQR